MSIMVSRMCGGVQQRARVGLHMAEQMVVRDISGPPLGTGLHVPTKQTKVVFMSSKWSCGSFKGFRTHAARYNLLHGIPQGNLIL